MRTAWEQGYSYVTTKINAAIEDHDVQIEFNPTFDEAHTLVVAIQRFCNAVIIIRPYALYLPRDSELGPWPIGFLNGMNNQILLVGRDCSTDEKFDDILAFLSERDWPKAEFEQCIVKGVEFYSAAWRKFFDDLEESITSQSRDPVPMPAELKRTEWSGPKSPSQWAKVFDCSWKTIKRRMDSGILRFKCESTKSYRIHVDDIPPSSQ